MNERARARGHARLRAHEHGRVVCAHSIFFELRRKGVAGHRPRALATTRRPSLTLLGPLLMNFRARVSHHHSPCRAAVRTCSAAMELTYKAIRQLCICIPPSVVPAVGCHYESPGVSGALAICLQVGLLLAILGGWWPLGQSLTHT